MVKSHASDSGSGRRLRTHRHVLDQRLADATEPFASGPTLGVPIHPLELRIDPTDEILFVEADVIQAGQVIAREDISIRVEKLEGDYR